MTSRTSCRIILQTHSIPFAFASLPSLLLGFANRACVSFSLGAHRKLGSLPVHLLSGCASAGIKGAPVLATATGLVRVISAPSSVAA